MREVGAGPTAEAGTMATRREEKNGTKWSSEEVEKVAEAMVMEAASSDEPAGMSDRDDEWETGIH